MLNKPICRCTTCNTSYNANPRDDIYNKCPQCREAPISDEEYMRRLYQRIMDDQIRHNKELRRKLNLE